MDTSCNFYLQESRPYFTGENMKGFVVWVTESEKKVEYIAVKLVGRSTVRINPATKATHHIFVNQIAFVHNEGVFPPGTYAHEFWFDIPAQGHSSFESSRGYVRYEIELFIKLADNEDLAFIKPVTVIKKLDLNSSMHYMMPRKSSLKTISWCLYNQRHSIIYNLKTNFSAYVPGQVMTYSLEIINRDCDIFKGFVIEFNRITTYRTKSPTFAQEQCTAVLLSRTVAIAEFNKDVYSGYFCIPATPPTNVSNSLISIEYFLQVTVLLPEQFGRYYFRMPITIGTVPTIAAIPPLAEFILAQPLTILHVVLIKSLAMLWPPTYQADSMPEGNFIDLDINEKYRIVGYKPTYPVYNMPEADERLSIIRV